MRPAEFESLSDAVTVSKAERDVARALIDTMAEDYDPSQYHDEYRQALEEVVQAKATGGESYIATDGKGLAQSMHTILDSLEKTKFEASKSSFEDLFQLLLVPGVLLVGLDALLRAWLLRRFP